MTGHRFRQAFKLALVIAGLALFAIVLRFGTRYYELQNATPLLEATRFQNLRAVEQTLSLGANPNVRNERGRVPLHIAVFKNNFDILELLLSHGADPNLADIHGMTPIEFASGPEALAIAHELRDHGAHYTARTALLVRDAKSLGSMLNVEPGLVHKTFRNNVNKQKTLLETAIRLKAYRMVSLLLEHGADSNAVSEYGRTPLMAAIQMNFPEDLIDQMIRLDPHVDARDDAGQTLLFFAVNAGDVDLVRTIVALGADVNVKDNNGSSPLSAVGSGPHFPTIFELLVQHGASADVRSAQGFTLLHYAAQRTDFDLADYLLTLGLDVNALDKLGRSPYWVTRSEEMKRFLVKRGAETNPVDEDGNTVLHIVVRSSSHSSVRRLIEQGADLDARNNDGLRPLDNAPPDLLAYLRQRQLIPPEQ